MGAGALFAASAGLQLVGGLSAAAESRRQAKEALRQSEKNQELEADRVKQQIARNTALFAKSGVSLSGSPLLVLEEDAATGAANVEDIARAGRAQATQLRARGRSALLGSFGAAGQAFGQAKGASTPVATPQAG